MDLRTAYTIQANFAENINVVNGYSLEESANSDKMISNIACLAAHLGWDHEIDSDFDKEENPDIFKDAPTQYVRDNLTAWYEVVGLIADSGRGLKGSF